jgi:hypothetical protein
MIVAGRTAQEVFLLPPVLNAIPGAGVDAKLDTFGGLLQELAASEVVFCET